MSVVAWVLLVPFGMLGIRILISFMKGNSLNLTTTLFLVLSISISAICCGILWGGLTFP